MYYGAEFPTFLEGFAPFGHVPYLADVARLEQALRQSFHAADADPVDPAALENLPPEKLATVRLGLSPATELVRSPWPIHAIRAFNMEDGAPKPAPGGQNVLVTRPEFDPRTTVVDDATAAFVTALTAGDTLSDAHDRALSADAGFDLAPALVLLLDERAIVTLETETSSTDRVPA